MATPTHIGLTITILVLLMTTVDIRGNRFGNVTAKCCRKGGALYPSVESPPPTPSPSESPLTLPPGADLGRKSAMNPSMASPSPSPSPSVSPLTIPLIASPANSPYLLTYRGRGGQ
ncbi:hypothetical protein AgCh_028604 [Apium graveolens]